MNCLKNSRFLLSRLLRHQPAVRTAPAPAPPHAPPPRYYHTFCILRDKPAVRPPPAARRYLHSPPRRRQEVIHFSTCHGGGSRWYHDKGKLTAAVLVTGAGVLGAAAVYFAKREAVPYTNRSHFVILSPKLERLLGELQFAALKRKLASKILPAHHPDSLRVRRITAEIVGAVHRGLARRQGHAAAASHGEDAAHGHGEISGDLTNQTSYHLDRLSNWEVIVVRDRRVNAMCAPGGKIVVFTGLLDVLKEDAEIATVLGHEVGHAIARHSAEQITKSLGVLILEIVIVQFISISDDALTAISDLLFKLPFSRRMEMEADHIGLQLLAAAGYDPRVAPGVYEKFGKIGGDSELRNYLSTHPSCKKRSQLLSEEHVMNEALELYREFSAEGSL